MVELEANRPDGPKVAGSPADKSSPVKDRSPPTESQPDLLHSQAGLQAPHVQAQPQVQSLIYVSLVPTAALVHGRVRWQMVYCAF